MIRMVGKRIIIPRGDTGLFTLPVKGYNSEGDVAVFSVKDCLTQETVIEKIVDASGTHLLIELKHEDTAYLPAAKYLYDIKIYRHPEYDEDGVLTGAMEIDSYYSAFDKSLLVIKEVAKNNG